MTQSLDEFVKEIHADIDNFAIAYMKKSIEKPEHYPLVFDEDNIGSWFEFFMMFCQSGEA